MSSGLNISKISLFFKHISDQANKIVDALSRRNLIIQESQVQIMGFDFMDLYEEDADFKEAYKACKNLEIQDKSLWIDYMLQEGLLFKNNHL